MIETGVTKNILLILVEEIVMDVKINYNIVMNVWIINIYVFVVQFQKGFAKNVNNNWKINNWYKRMKSTLIVSKINKYLISYILGMSGRNMDWCNKCKTINKCKRDMKELYCERCD